MRGCICLFWRIQPLPYSKKLQNKYYLSPSPQISPLSVNNHKLTTAAENPSPEASPMPTSTPTGMKPSIHSMGWKSPKNSCVGFTRMGLRSRVPFSRGRLSRLCWEEIWLLKLSLVRWVKLLCHALYTIYEQIKIYACGRNCIHDVYLAGREWRLLKNTIFRVWKESPSSCR